MALFYITGISGSGKSTVLAELKSQGYEAYGTDEDAIAYFYNNETGEAFANTFTAADRTPAWREKYTWKASKQRIEELKELSRDKAVFICGVVSNEDEIWDLFSKVFALIIDDQTLKQRIATRINNDFGKSPHELEDILKWQSSAKDEYQKFGAVIVDAAQPVKIVVSTILAQT